MEQFVWSESYSVNNDELDSHHKNLIHIFNKLYTSYLANDNSVVIANTIVELVSYTLYHFAAEENFMRETGYVNLGHHLSQHTFFRNEIYQLQHRNLSNDPEVTQELVVYLGNWLLRHVMVEDRKYAI